MQSSPPKFRGALPSEVTLSRNTLLGAFRSGGRGIIFLSFFCFCYGFIKVVGGEDISVVLSLLSRQILAQTETPFDSVSGLWGVAHIYTIARGILQRHFNKTNAF